MNADELTKEINRRIIENAQQMTVDAKEPNQNTWTFRNLREYAKETYELGRLLTEMDEEPNSDIAWAIRRFNKVTHNTND